MKKCSGSVRTEANGPDLFTCGLCGCEIDTLDQYIDLGFMVASNDLMTAKDLASVDEGFGFAEQMDLDDEIQVETVEYAETIQFFCSWGCWNEVRSAVEAAVQREARRRSEGLISKSGLSQPKSAPLDPPRDTSGGNGGRRR